MEEQTRGSIEGAGEEELFLEAAAEEEAVHSDKYLLFHLGEELYGIPIAAITEIVGIQRITGVPDMPSYVKGVINLRGKVIPVVDLRLRFGMQERSYDDRTCSIIIQVGDAAVGLIVDTVAEVRDILRQDVEAVPEFRAESGVNRYVSGLGKIGERVSVLIDPQRILQQNDFGTLSNATQTTGAETLERRV